MSDTTDLPSFLTRTGPHSYTLTFSASAAECFMLCPAKYSWSRLTEIEAAAPRAGMNYGKAMHLALAYRYGHMNQSLKEVEEVAGGIMAGHFEANPQPEMGRKGRPEWRTLARARQAFLAYNERYPAEDFEVLGVEEPFEVELGTFEIPSTNSQCFCTVTVNFRGIRDLRVRWHDRLWVQDHKTQQEWSDLTVDEGKASFQFMVYAWVERLLAQQTEERRPLVMQGGTSTEFGNEQIRLAKGGAEPLAVGGVIGNYLIAREPYAEGRKPTPRDLPRDQFERVPYPYTDAQLDEWHSRAMGLARSIFTAWQAEEWPQHSTACAHWGRCEYYQLCWETDPAYRMAAALSGDYRKRTASPLDEPEAI